MRSEVDRMPTGSTADLQYDTRLDQHLAQDLEYGIFILIGGFAERFHNGELSILSCMIE